MKPNPLHQDPVEVRKVDDIVLLVLHDDVAGNLATAAEPIVAAPQRERLLPTNLVA